jgi:hypothetical protein
MMSRNLCLLGVLLTGLAFTAQQYFNQKWSSEIKTFEEANRDYTELSRASLAYQNLFIGLDSKTDSVSTNLKQIFIKAAADKYRTGKMISTHTEQLGTKTELAALAKKNNELSELISEVTDLNSLYGFVVVTNQTYPESKDQNGNWLEVKQAKKDQFSLIFAISQAIGAILLAFGLSKR